MSANTVVSRAEWIEARKKLLSTEKEFTRLRDKLGRQTRDLPWVRVEKDYVFDGPDGRESLADLFGTNSQLIVYHFMFDPDWQEGCTACSFMADHFDPLIVHLNQRDVTMLAVSRAPLPKLEAFRRRMGWRFKWVSSQENEFNWDYHVSFTQDQVERGEIRYNYQTETRFLGTELPGLSVFFKDGNGRIFHTYSSFARGLETFLGVYRLLDVVPKGRDEDGLAYGMEWLRLHDRYDDFVVLGGT